VDNLEINLEKLSGIEKELAEIFLKEHPDPICIFGDCAEKAVHLKFSIKNRVDSENALVKVDAYCKHHFIEKKWSKIQN